MEIISRFIVGVFLRGRALDTDLLFDSIDKPHRHLEFGKLLIAKFSERLFIIIPIVLESEHKRKVTCGKRASYHQGAC